jgi:hypothetical protein
MPLAVDAREHVRVSGSAIHRELAGARLWDRTGPQTNGRAIAVDLNRVDADETDREIRARHHGTQFLCGGTRFGGEFLSGDE